MDNDPPPPYDFKDVPLAATEQTSQSLATSATAKPHPSAPAPSQQQNPIHPLLAHLHTHQPLGLYHAGLSDLCLSTSADSPPLCHVTIHSLRTPSITLHTSSTPQSPTLGTAQYNFLSATDVEIFEPRRTTTTAGTTKAAQASTSTQLQKTGWLPESWGFEMLLLPTGQREQFEWKYSRGAEVAAMEGRNRGLKCVRSATAEVVCAWAWTAVSARKVGKLRLLQELGGGEAELVVLVTLLAVVERIRRDENNGLGSGGGRMV